MTGLSELVLWLTLASYFYSYIVRRNKVVLTQHGIHVLKLMS